MPVLGAGDPIPRRPRRVLVAGTSGSGKTTLAGRIAAVLGCPHVEIDALHHGPGWVERENFEDDVRRLAEGPTWTTEWQYAAVRALLLDRADCLVWLDLARRTVMARVIRRTLRRRLRRERLWNDNLEPPLWTIVTDPGHVVRWAWKTHAKRRRQVIEAAGQRRDLTIVRLLDPAEVDAWVAGPLARCADG